MNTSAATETEVPSKGQRRRFSAEYKRKVLQEAQACTKQGELAALLRREGLYSSHLTAWRRLREAGELSDMVSTELRFEYPTATRIGIILAGPSPGAVKVVIQFYDSSL